MAFMDRIKRDITRHRHKAAVLGVLFVVMIVMTVRAVVQLQPKAAAAAIVVDGATAIDPLKQEGEATPNAGVDADERIRQSKELWRTLREVRGAEASVAFSFDSSFYPPDPSRPVAAAAPARLEAAPATPIPDQTEALRRAQVAAIREQSHVLIVKSTTMSGSAKPWAIVNQQLVSVGQEVLGFEITAIRSREVEFIKDGVPIVVKMSDDIRGQ